MLVALPQNYKVYVFSGEAHDDSDAQTVKLNIALPELPVEVESWDVTKEGCCWEAYNENDNLVAYRTCKGK